MRQRISEILAPFGVEHFGVCRFEDCLPLLPCLGARRLPEQARSVIVCLFPYRIGEWEARNVARYAVPPDYHKVAGGILQGLADSLARTSPGHLFVPFVDSSPLREVAAARLAGLGVVGRHGQLIHEVYGCQAFLGTVVTDLEISPDRPLEGGCLDCGRCLAACPTGALAPDRPLRRERCRSHITQKKGPLSPWEEAQIREGGLVWGCDLCTDACPMNTGVFTPITAFYENPAPLLTEANLDRLLEEKPYGYRGRAVLMRNVTLIRS